MTAFEVFVICFGTVTTVVAAWVWFYVLPRTKVTAKPIRRPRAVMGRIYCPGGCNLRVAFSSRTLLTAPHNCKDGRRVQVRVLADREVHS